MDELSPKYVVFIVILDVVILVVSVFEIVVVFVVVNNRLHKLLPHKVYIVQHWLIQDVAVPLKFSPPVIIILPPVIVTSPLTLLISVLPVSGILSQPTVTELKDVSTVYKINIKLIFKKNLN